MRSYRGGPEWSAGKRHFCRLLLGLEMKTQTNNQNTGVLEYLLFGHLQAKCWVVVGGTWLSDHLLIAPGEGQLQDTGDEEGDTGGTSDVTCQCLIEEPV